MFERDTFPSSASQSLHTRQLLTAAVIAEIVRELAHRLIVVVSNLFRASSWIFSKTRWLRPVGRLFIRFCGRRAAAEHEQVKWTKGNQTIKVAHKESAGGLCFTWLHFSVTARLVKAEAVADFEGAAPRWHGEIRADRKWTRSRDGGWILFHSLARPLSPSPPFCWFTFGWWVSWFLSR